MCKRKETWERQEIGQVRPNVEVEILISRLVAGKIYRGERQSFSVKVRYDFYPFLFILPRIVQITTRITLLNRASRIIISPSFSPLLSLSPRLAKIIFNPDKLKYLLPFLFFLALIDLPSLGESSTEDIYLPSHRFPRYR